MKHLPIILFFVATQLSGQVKYEYLTTGDDVSGTITNDDQMRGFNFTVGSVGDQETFTLNAIRVKAHKTGSPGTVTVSVKELAGNGYGPTGAAISTGTLDLSGVAAGTDTSWCEASMSACILEATRKYVVQLSAESVDGSNYPGFRVSTVSGYPGGNAIYSNDSGTNWTNLTSYDYMFEIYGDKEYALFYNGYRLSVGGSLGGYIKKSKLVYVDQTTPIPNPDQDTSINILWFHDFDDLEVDAYDYYEWEDYWLNEGFDEGELYASSGGNWNYSSTVWPNGVLDDGDMSLRLGQYAGTEGNDHTFDYRITLGETLDSTDTDRYFRFWVKKSGGWSSIGNAEWKMNGLISGTWWDYNTGYSFEWDSTVYKDNYDEGGYGYIQDQWCGYYEPRRRVWDWVKIKVMGDAIAGGTSYHPRIYPGCDAIVWISNKADIITDVTKTYSSDWYSITMRQVTGTNENADGFWEWYVDDTLVYRADNEWLQDRIISWDPGIEECPWLGTQSDYDSLVMKDQGISSSQILIDFHVTCDPGEEATSNIYMHYDKFLLFQYSPDYDSAYYNQPRPMGSVLRGIPSTYDRQQFPWWWALLLISLIFSRKRRRQ